MGSPTSRRRVVGVCSDRGCDTRTDGFRCRSVPADHRVGACRGRTCGSRTGVLAVGELRGGRTRTGRSSGTLDISAVKSESAGRRDRGTLARSCGSSASPTNGSISSSGCAVGSMPRCTATQPSHCGRCSGIVLPPWNCTACRIQTTGNNSRSSPASTSHGKRRWTQAVAELLFVAARSELAVEEHPQATPAAHQRAIAWLERIETAYRPIPAVYLWIAQSQRALGQEQAGSRS